MGWTRDHWLRCQYPYSFWYHPFPIKSMLCIRALNVQKSKTYLQMNIAIEVMYAPPATKVFTCLFMYSLYYFRPYVICCISLHKNWITLQNHKVSIDWFDLVFMYSDSAAVNIYQDIYQVYTVDNLTIWLRKSFYSSAQYNLFTLSVVRKHNCSLSSRNWITYDFIPSTNSVTKDNSDNFIEIYLVIPNDSWRNVHPNGSYISCYQCTSMTGRHQNRCAYS